MQVLFRIRLPPDLVFSLTKPSPVATFAGRKLVTIFAIRPRRTSSPSVRLRLSITLPVRCARRLYELRLMYCPDFCIFAPASPNSTIADTEGEEVAWCTQPGHGTRIIPPGTFTGLQVLNNSNYIQYVGFVNQGNINIYPGDFGGELDPHGQDLVRCVQRALESCL